MLSELANDVFKKMQNNESFRAEMRKGYSEDISDLGVALDRAKKSIEFSVKDQIRNVFVKTYNTTEIMCYNCHARFKYKHRLGSRLVKVGHGLKYKSDDGIKFYLSCKECKDTSSLHYYGETWE